MLVTWPVLWAEHSVDVRCYTREEGPSCGKEGEMFARVGEFWDIAVFAFVLLILATWQLRYASVAEGIVALAALVCGVALLYPKKWGVGATCITLVVAALVYFAQAWYLPIIHGDGHYIMANIFKMFVAALLLWYIGRGRIEERFAS